MTEVKNTGIVITGEFYESDAMSVGVSNLGPHTYTPSTGINSCVSGFRWIPPEDAVAGDVYRVFVTVRYSGFDRSNTSGTFSMWWQGANYKKSTESNAWEGPNLICSALSSAYNITNLVLSSTNGTYTYETTFTLTSAYLTDYHGSYVGLRSDYSNGTASITISDLKVIPEKYAISNTTGEVKLRLANNYISANNFIEI